ncbi:flagellar biosynthesis protein [Roseovarius sp. A21]|uniref:Flagellar biosynthesis protein n=1 Tax=Roseovarius bejariae TaxID=2576383 RepID=A0A844D2L7_9RHOB|nr:flagellar biosynthesis protein [Roseovarius bejariae]MRU15468.1 flagellar biosynthesis protein [Roseovarius bejariae]
MTISHLLEDFSALTDGEPVAITDVALEEEKLAAFEKGYQAGWDDSTKAASDESGHISAEFAQTLQDLSFTLHEAQAAALRSLKPLLDQMVEAVLPKLAQDSLGERVREILDDFLDRQEPAPVSILAAPETAPALEALIEGQDPLPVTVTAEPTMTEGQLRLHFGSAEREIDTKAVLADISKAIEAYYADTLNDMKDTA